MRILVLNAGSATLKFSRHDVSMRDAPSFSGRRDGDIRGMVDRIGGAATLTLQTDGVRHAPQEREILDHRQAVQWVFEHLRDAGMEAVGHRVVHGGERFTKAVRVDDSVVAEIERLGELAPLHNPACVATMRAAREAVGERMPMVAVFDTAFHHALPVPAATYAIPHGLASAHRVRRYGFHGIAHGSMLATYVEATGAPIERTRLITLHLGNGCSAAAIQGGRSVDTSMGFTPMEGLVMGTRCGDVDPGIIGYLARRERMSLDEMDRRLNHESGLLGLSGRSHDMRDLLAAERTGDARARLAIEVFCYRARKYMGAYLAVLGGADAVLFGGGIGEHAPEIRARICDGMEWCGMRLERERNAQAIGVPAGSAVRISTDEATLAAYVVAVDEETAIACETGRCLGGEGAS